MDQPPSGPRITRCFRCQWKRQIAAVQYMRAADEVRVLVQVAAARGDHPDLWVTKFHWHAVRLWSRALTDAGLTEQKE